MRKFLYNYTRIYRPLRGRRVGGADCSSSFSFFVPKKEKLRQKKKMFLDA